MVAPRLDDPDWQRVGWHYRFLYDHARWWHHPFVRVRLRGQENFPREGPFILASNHTSYWDPILLFGVCRRPVHWLAKKEVMSNPVSRAIVGGAGCIPVDRSASSKDDVTAAVTDLLGRGGILGIFPEGTRNDGHGLLDPRSGVGRFALATGAPVVPVGILTDRFWPQSRTLPRLREPVYVDVGEPVRFHGDAGDPIATRRAAERVMKDVGGLLREGRRARDAGDEWTLVRDLRHVKDRATGG